MRPPLAGVLVAAVCLSAGGARGEETFSVVLKGTLTTGSRLFPHPASADPAERAAYLPIENSPGAGVEVRYRIPGTDILVGLSGEYLRARREGVLPGLFSVPVPVEDGYRAWPVELTGYFRIPVAGPEVRITMGGGGGVYFGERVYRVAGTAALPVDRTPGFGIHVLGGAGYRLADWCTVEAEMKFRDVQFESVNAFREPEIFYGTMVVNVGGAPERARIETDGVVFQIAVRIHVP
ncbi:MAG: hypothetical protein WB626_07085 [Bacteroidota bacterium]